MGFWGQQKWLDSLQSDNPVVKHYNPDRLKEGCYRLCLGAEAIVSSTTDDRRGSYRTLGAGQMLNLEPGNFAYLITEETVNIPQNAIGLINVATASKLDGLINISGFHADPWYSGKLVFTVFNSGPTLISLWAGEPLFRLWLSDFDPPAIERPAPGYKELDKRWVSRLHGVYPSSFAIAEKVNKLESDVKSILDQRRFNDFILLIVTLLLAPFAAAMYVEFCKKYLGGG